MNKNFISLCPIMTSLYERYGECPIPNERHYSAYESLFRAIVYQQLSGKAADTILGRVLKLFDLDILGDIVSFPSPQAFLLMEEDALRGAGLSWNKIRAIKDLSQKQIDGIVPTATEVTTLSNEEIIERLIQVRGIGRWSVEMYLIFTLGREDVWPTDDLGVRKGFAHAYGLTEMPTPKQIATMADHLKPFRSYAAWYCWRVCSDLKLQQKASDKKVSPKKTKSPKAKSKSSEPDIDILDDLGLK